MKLILALSAAVAVAPLASVGDVAHAGEVPDEAPQVIVLKLDDVVAHRSADGSPVSPRWERVTGFLRESKIKASFGIIDYLESRGCVFMTPSQYLEKVADDGKGD